MRAIDRVTPYYVLIVRNLFDDRKGTYETFAKLIFKFNEIYKNHFDRTPYSALHQRMVLHAIRSLVKKDAVRVVQDEFAPEFLIWSIKGIPQLLVIEPTAQPIADKMATLGGHNNSLFLFEAIRGFAERHEEEATKFLDELDAQREIEINDSSDAEAEDDASDEDTNDSEAEKLEREDSWVPLPLDRESPEAREAIEKAEIALKEIEQSNGYAATEAEERNGIVSSIRGSLETIKLGLPSRQSIVAGLLAPLKFISKKFSEASMGEAAKIAVAAIVKWLS